MHWDPTYVKLNGNCQNNIYCEYYIAESYNITV